MARTAATATFPAIHPLAVVVVLAGDELRRLRIQHALHRCKKIITARHGLGTEALVGQVHVVAHQLDDLGFLGDGFHAGYLDGMGWVRVLTAVLRCGP
jgi:hypothetical protein